MRCSAGESLGGIIPISRAKLMLSVKASLAWISPSLTVSRSQPSRSTTLPVGLMPEKLPGPAKVPRMCQWTAQRSPWAVVETTSICRSGNAPSISEMNARTPSGASTSSCPRTFSRPPSAHSATAPSRSRESIASK